MNQSGVPLFLIAEASRWASREHVPMAAGTEALAPGTVLAIADGGQWRAFDPAVDREATGILLGAVIDGEAVVIAQHAEVWRPHLVGLHKDAMRGLAIRDIVVL